ncbi:MAG: hypothetical protein ACK4P8_01815 [Tabrizicola sp.]
MVAPFRYMRVVFSMGPGVVPLAGHPDAATRCGAGLIIGSGLCAFARERIRKRASPAVSAGVKGPGERNSA